MNLPRERNDDLGGDWAELGNAWRGQPLPADDLAALRRDAGRSGRWLRGWLGFELATTAVASGMCAWGAASSDSPFAAPVAAAVIVLLLAFQGWSLWIRRRQIRETGLDARALLALEQARVRTSRRYWRLNAWAVLAMWAGLWGVLWFGLTTAGEVPPELSPPRMRGSLLACLPVVLVTAVFACWHARRGRRRLARLQALHEQLEDE